MFAKKVLPEDADEAQIRRFETGLGGTLIPVMSVDKTPDELTDFAALARDSHQMTDDWDMLFVAALSGHDQQAPRSEDADAPIQHMIRMLQTGTELNKLVCFDREGAPISIT